MCNYSFCICSSRCIYWIYWCIYIYNMNIFCGWRVNELGPPVNFEVIGNGELWDALGQSVSQRNYESGSTGEKRRVDHMLLNTLGPWAPWEGKKREQWWAMCQTRQNSKECRYRGPNRRQGYQGRRCAKNREPSPENGLWTSNCTKKARAHRMAMQNVKRKYTSSSHKSMATKLA